jgi:hypothetical protein
MKNRNQVLALFDYYRDTNVQDRHKWAFEQARDVLTQYEGSRQMTQGSMTKAWKKYIDLQYSNMGTFAGNWLDVKLTELRATWALIALSSNRPLAQWAGIN